MSACRPTGPRPAARTAAKVTSGSGCRERARLDGGTPRSPRERLDGGTVVSHDEPVPIRVGDILSEAYTTSGRAPLSLDRPCASWLIGATGATPRRLSRARLPTPLRGGRRTARCRGHARGTCPRCGAISVLARGAAFTYRMRSALPSGRRQCTECLMRDPHRGPHVSTPDADFGPVAFAVARSSSAPAHHRAVSPGCCTRAARTTAPRPPRRGWHGCDRRSPPSAEARGRAPRR